MLNKDKTTYTYTFADGERAVVDLTAPGITPELVQALDELDHQDAALSRSARRHEVLVPNLVSCEVPELDPFLNLNAVSGPAEQVQNRLLLQQAIENFSESQLRLCRKLSAGEPQKQIAREEGVVPSAINARMNTLRKTLCRELERD